MVKKKQNKKNEYPLLYCPSIFSAKKILFTAIGLHYRNTGPRNERDNIYRERNKIETFKDETLYSNANTVK